MYNDNDIVYSKLRDIPINAPSRANHQWSSGKFEEKLEHYFFEIPFHI